MAARRNINQFRYPDTGSAKGLQYQQGPFAAGQAGGFQQAEIFAAVQFPPRITKDAALALQGFGLAPGVFAKFLVAVHGRQHGIDTGRRIAPCHQAVPPGRHRLFVGFLRGACLPEKAVQITDIFFNGPGAVFTGCHPVTIALYAHTHLSLSHHFLRVFQTFHVLLRGAVPKSPSPSARVPCGAGFKAPPCSIAQSMACSPAGYTKKPRRPHPRRDFLCHVSAHCSTVTQTISVRPWVRSR